MIVNKSGMRKEKSLCPADKMCLVIKAFHHSSVSAGCIPGTQTFYKAMEENLHAAGCLSKFMNVFSSEKSLFFLYMTNTSKPLTAAQVSEQIRPSSEQRKEKGCTAPWIKPHYETIVSAILPEFIDGCLKHLYPCN